jgi:uncharacterized membrane protein
LGNTIEGCLLVELQLLLGLVLGQLILPAILIAKCRVFVRVIILEVDAKVGIAGMLGKLETPILVLGGIGCIFCSYTSLNRANSE